MLPKVSVGLDAEAWLHVPGGPPHLQLKSGSPQGGHSAIR